MEINSINLKSENERLRQRISELESRFRNQNKTAKKIKFRSFDFEKYTLRHIAIQICYLGWSYSGLVAQLEVENTVIETIYNALERCKLIENREKCEIIVCGRTDKGVSGYQQVISLDVRSNLKEGKGIISGTGPNISERKDSCDQEIDFIFLLNKVLPKDIRALKWSPVDLDFNARFNCNSRSYKYFIPKSNLSLDLMRNAGKKLTGEHDFRNFCSMQINQGIISYIRTIFHFSIEPFDKDQKDDMYNIYVINIQASAFVYHQIRCIVAVILMIGQGVEDISIIDKLLDIDGFGGLGRPQYNMASHLPLVFYEASYDDLQWQVSEEALTEYINDIDHLWVDYKMKETMLKLFITEIESENPQMKGRKSLITSLTNESSLKTRKLLSNRIKEATLEERIVLENIKRAKKSKDLLY